MLGNGPGLSIEIIGGSTVILGGAELDSRYR